MIAVVLAAGRGTRLGAPVPKALVPVAGIPVIERILTALADEGFDDVAVVTGYEADAVESHLGGSPVRFARQTEPSGTANALLAARSAIDDAPFLLSWGDVIVPSGTYRRVAVAAAGTDGAVAVNHLDDLSAGGAVTVEHGLAVGVVEKPGPLQGWNLTGVLALTHGIWEHAEALEPSVRDEYELPEAVDAWIGSGAEVAAVTVAEPLFEIGTPEALAAADAYFSSDIRER